MTQKKVQLILGLWILISPWVLGFSSNSLLKWSNVLTGTAIFLMGIWAIFGVDKTSS